jgi:hypothetical protein
MKFLLVAKQEKMATADEGGLVRALDAVGCRAATRRGRRRSVQLAFSR